MYHIHVYIYIYVYVYVIDMCIYRCIYMYRVIGNANDPSNNWPPMQP